MATEKTQYAETLAKEYELGNTKEDFFNYIVDSMSNGQRKQTKDLFLKMDNDDKQEFLTTWLDVKIGIHKSTLNTCIVSLLN